MRLTGKILFALKTVLLWVRAIEGKVGAVSGALSYLSGSHELDIRTHYIGVSRRTQELSEGPDHRGFPRALDCSRFRRRSANKCCLRHDQRP